MTTNVIIDQNKSEQNAPHARNSALELLRILGMITIVFHHFAVHGGFEFSSASITLNTLWYQFIYMVGLLFGNHIFVLISGYFLISSDGPKFRKLFAMWFEIFFYSVAIYLIFTLSGHETFSFKALFLSMRPVSQTLYWFPATYIILYILHGWLNLFLKSLSRENYLKFLATLLGLWCILSTLLQSELSGSDLMTFILLYSLGGYFRLWGSNVGSNKFILYGLGFIAVSYLIIVISDIIGQNFPFFDIHIIYFYLLAMTRPFPLAVALCLLIGFRSLRVPYSKIINLMASATFGVYLIHDNNLVRPFLWREVFRNASFQDSPYLIPYSIIVVLFVYVLCILIELARAKLFALCRADSLAAKFADSCEHLLQRWLNC